MSIEGSHEIRNGDRDRTRDRDRNNDRLDSWKRIARYLDRGVRTVRRWEAEEQMPVHRHAHKSQGSVYAFKSELDEWLRRRSGSAGKKPAAERQRMVAVLPFQNLSGNPEHEFLADGFTEELIGHLGQLPRAHLGVIARTSAMLYKNAAKSVDEIAKELGVDFVFEGSIRVHGARARVTGQLIHTRDQTHVWARHYERGTDDLLALQSGVSHEIAKDISERLIAGEPAGEVPAPAALPSIDRHAFETYLKARALLYRMTGESVGRSIESFEAVIADEPGFAPAYAGLAEALLLATIWAPLPPRQTMPRAFEAISRAVSLDPDSAEAYAVLGFIHYMYTWDWNAAEVAFQRAIRINPNLAIGHQWYAEFLAAMGRFDEAKQRIEAAERLDPFSLAVASSRGHVLWLAREADALLSAMGKVVDVEARYPLAHIFIILAHLMKGDFEASIDSTYKAMEACDEAYFFVGLLGAAAGAAGRRDLAREQLEELERMARGQYVPQTIFCGPCLGTGDIDRALTHLEKARDEREWHIATLATSSMCDPLRGHPRFQRLLEEVGLAELDARLNGQR